MKGRLVCRCCACGLEKGDGDPNEGWWTLVSRTVSPKLRRTTDGQSFCPSCAPALLVRSDEVQSNPAAVAGLRIVPVLWLRGMLMALTSATQGFEPRETIGWSFAEKVARLIGYEKFPRSLPCREVGFISSKEAS